MNIEEIIQYWTAYKLEIHKRNDKLLEEDAERLMKMAQDLCTFLPPPPLLESPTIEGLLDYIEKKL